MKNTELKAIGHCVKLLDNIEAYRIYSIVSNKLNEHEMEKDKQANTLYALQEEANIMNNQIRECKDWLGVIIKDLKDTNA